MKKIISIFTKVFFIILVNTASTCKGLKFFFDSEAYRRKEINTEFNSLLEKNRGGEAFKILEKNSDVIDFQFISEGKENFKSYRTEAYLLAYLNNDKGTGNRKKMVKFIMENSLDNIQLLETYTISTGFFASKEESFVSTLANVPIYHESFIALLKQKRELINKKISLRTSLLGDFKQTILFMLLNKYNDKELTSENKEILFEKIKFITSQQPNLKIESNFIPKDQNKKKRRINITPLQLLAIKDYNPEDVKGLVELLKKCKNYDVHHGGSYHKSAKHIAIEKNNHILTEIFQ